jgi:hypothetical protein
VREHLVDLTEEGDQRRRRGSHYNFLDADLDLLFLQYLRNKRTAWSRDPFVLRPDYARDLLLSKEEMLGSRLAEGWTLARTALRGSYLGDPEGIVHVPLQTGFGHWVYVLYDGRSAGAGTAYVFDSLHQELDVEEIGLLGQMFGVAWPTCFPEEWVIRQAGEDLISRQVDSYNCGPWVYRFFQWGLAILRDGLGQEDLELGWRRFRDEALLNLVGVRLLLCRLWGDPISELADDQSPPKAKAKAMRKGKATPALKSTEKPTLQAERMSTKKATKRVSFGEDQVFVLIDPPASQEATLSLCTGSDGSEGARSPPPLPRRAPGQRIFDRVKTTSPSAGATQPRAPAAARPAGYNSLSIEAYLRKYSVSGTNQLPCLQSRIHDPQMRDRIDVALSNVAGKRLKPLCLDLDSVVRIYSLQGRFERNCSHSYAVHRCRSTQCSPRPANATSDGKGSSDEDSI